MRWTKPKSSRITGPTTSELRERRETLAIVQQTSGNEWFWYTYGQQIRERRNTAGSPCATLEEAQAQAEAHIRQDLKRTP